MNIFQFTENAKNMINKHVLLLHNYDKITNYKALNKLFENKVTKL